MRRLLLFWLLLTGLAVAQTTLLGSAQQLAAAAREGAAQPAPTWGEGQAREDLQRLQRAAETLVQRLETEPQVTPADLHALRDELLVCRGRLLASLPLTGRPEGTLLQQLDAVMLCLRTLEYRFAGRAQPIGPELAAAPLAEATQLPVYADPRELWGEARNVSYLAQASTRLRAVWPGQASPGADFGREFYDFVAAAQHYETITNTEYRDVRETRRAYERLVRTYERFRSFGYGLDAFRWSQLETAMARLAQFYASAP